MADPPEGRIRLRLVVPSHTVLDEPATKVVAEAENGCFGLLPRHIDFAAALVPGLLLYETPAGEERVVAVDQGILVKCGRDVRVSVRNAVRGESLDTLRATVRDVYERVDEHEEAARSAVARLEAAILRRFIALEHR